MMGSCIYRDTRYARVLFCYYLFFHIRYLDLNSDGLHTYIGMNVCVFVCETGLEPLL
jgi:hypothetical protein